MNGYPDRTIVFATDFSDASARAGRRAAALARREGARMHLVHVDPPLTAPSEPWRLGAAATDVGAGVDLTVAALSGIPARQICAYARRVGADLIVVGTHGRTGLSRALLGSVAEAVVRHAPCAVMTVPAAEDDGAQFDAADTLCVVCTKPSPDLICEPCRGIIRGERLVGGRTTAWSGRLAS